MAVSSILSISSPVRSSSTETPASCSNANKVLEDKSILLEDHANKDVMPNNSESCDEISDGCSKSESKDFKTVHKSFNHDSSERQLRKRKINLNALSSNLTCPKVCQYSNCGIQLPSSDALEWHYEGHFSQEVEKLDKLKVKKPNIPKASSDECLIVRRPLRNSVVDRIRFNREKRLARRSLIRYDVIVSSELD